jgi:hypothetical protein
MKTLNHAGPGLLIAIPTLGRPVPLDWAMAFKGLSPPINFNVNYGVIYGRQVADARNAFAEQAITSGCKYLFFLGDDVVVPAHTLKQLLFRMENTPSLLVVGGVYCSKCEPSAPLVFKGDGVGSYWDWKLGEFFPVTGLGMDCTLIKTEVFNKLSKPWFKTVDEDQHLDGINSAEMWTEDLYFLKKLREELGDDLVYCDASVICDHWDVYNNKKYSLPKDSLPMRQKVVTKDKKALILGPSIDLVDESYDVTRCGQDNGADYRLIFNNLPFEKDQFDWVIVTQPILGYNRLDFEEWLRVTKGKISVCFSEVLDPINLGKFITYNHKMEVKRDGNYLEMEKPVGSTS